MSSREAKQWTCIDCGGNVNRKVKRCATCNSAFRKGRVTYERTPESNAHMSNILKGRIMPIGWKHSEETRTKMKSVWTPEKRQAAKERGEKYAEDKDWRLRIANALSGKNNPRWLGGMTGGKYAPGFSKTLKHGIRERDNFTCQLCAKTEEELGYALSIHHADYDKTNHDELNLFATCKRCNSLVNTNRDIWEGYFMAWADARRHLGQDISHLLTRKVITQREGFISTRHNGGPDLAELLDGLY